MAKVKIKTILPETIIDIQVSGAYYTKITELIALIAGDMSLENFQKIGDKLKENKPPADTTEMNIMLLMMLVIEIEQQAIKQNKITDSEVEIPDEAKPSETTGS